jgi:hypothetical protein
MSIISRFERIDAAIARSLPQWPLSLIMVIAVCVGLGLAVLVNVVSP